MFYSHEILTSRQYGVATIWLVATIGSKSTAKRVSKKAIQEVDLVRACEKIIEPGAPIALRLQGNLLCGVSRVYQQKCHYMLTDVQKIQGHMVTFMQQFGAHQLNPGDIRARPENLMIMDDPDFFPDGNILPDPTADMFVLSQRSNRTSSQSQMSPHNLQSGASSSGNEQFPIQLELRASSISASQPSPHGLQGLSSAQKPVAMGGNEDLYGDDAGGPMDFGLHVDEHGNCFEFTDVIPAVLDEPELPPLPTTEGPEGAVVVQDPQLDEQGDIFMLYEQPLPEADALPDRQQESNDAAIVHKGQNENPAPTQRRKRCKIISADEDTTIPRKILQAWQTTYLENCCMPKPHSVSATQAKKNAIHLTFGLGIGNIGQSLGISGMSHPLATEFSGESLFTAYTGLEILGKNSRKRTQSATRSVDDNGPERRVRPRLGGDEEQRGRGLGMNDTIDLGQQQSPPEIGREAQAALDEHPSSALPWNRGSSLMPGSSMQRGNSVQLGRDQSSPLGGRSKAEDIVRYSSDADMGGMDFEAGGPHSASSLNGISPPVIPEETPAPVEPKVSTQVENQYTREALDREGKNFLGFVEDTVRENGERRHDEDFDRQRKWVDFNDVFVPIKTDRATAAQAFYHLLTLVTKGYMAVEQDDEGGHPFGGIHMGIKLNPGL